mmetsp:Transcript_1536/g.3091  ORF Transcript_1536/g.3091 Transcript_1536/m.3091 type:complete len:371 (-) Transcript_1536:388-1500(-)
MAEALPKYGQEKEDNVEKGDGKGEEKEEEEGNCPICYDSFVEKSKVIPCGHMFCWECIVEWSSVMLEGQAIANCPLCRRTSRFVQSIEQPRKSIEVGNTNRRRVTEIQCNDEHCLYQTLGDGSELSLAWHDMEPYAIKCHTCHIWYHGVCTGMLTPPQEPQTYTCDFCKEERRHSASTTLFAMPTAWISKEMCRDPFKIPVVYRPGQSQRVFEQELRIRIRQMRAQKKRAHPQTNDEILSGLRQKQLETGNSMGFGLLLQMGYNEGQSRDRAAAKVGRMEEVSLLRKQEEGEGEERVKRKTVRSTTDADIAMLWKQREQAIKKRKKKGKGQADAPVNEVAVVPKKDRKSKYQRTAESLLQKLATLPPPKK